MNELLEPLAQLPGVQLVLLSTPDGVPIAAAGRAAGQPIGEFGMTKDDGLAAMTAAWMNDVARAVAPLSWTAPDRVFLRGARGLLAMHHSRTSSLCVLLSRGISPEDLRLSMDGTIARIERTLRQARGEAPAVPVPSNDVPGAMPSFHASSQLPSEVDYDADGVVEGEAPRLFSPSEDS